jgi:hypothetical protein
MSTVFTLRSLAVPNVILLRPSVEVIASLNKNHLIFKQGSHVLLLECLNFQKG